MNNITKVMKLLSDPARLRIIMVLTKKEMCVCQIMGVLGISQPLVSKNLALLSSAGFLEERREGKLVFYSLRKRMASVNERLVGLLKEVLKSDRLLIRDLQSLKDCEEFQKRTGRCDMKTFSEFMAVKRKGR